MFGERERNIFKKLELNYPAVAVKFCRNRPEGIPRAEEKDAFCAFLAKAQQSDSPFYMTVENEDCMGKTVLGMQSLVDSPDGSVHGSGYMGKNLGAFRTPAANARLYYEAPMFKRNIVNYVVFCPVAACDFNPDLIVCVAETEKAEIILRASSYISGDVWESKCSFVMSCSWTYVYPYISGKINHLFTGMHLGLKKKGLYPPGLHILSIPYQKLPELMDALEEMDWELPFLGHGPEVEKLEAEMGEYMDKVKNDIEFPFPIK